MFWMKDIPKVPAKIFDDFLYSLELDEHELTELVIQSGWQQRTPRKITASALLAALCIESIQGEASFNDLSSRLDLLSDQKGPSRQGVSKRINTSFLKVLELLLARVIKAKAECGKLPFDDGDLCLHPRILVQDSTIIRLPGWLYESFSGVSNGHHQVCNARIQAVYDLKSMCFVSFEINPYTKTDQNSAPELELQKGDLVLRDRGYLNAPEIASHRKSGADCIYRHKTRTIHLDPDTQEPIDLLKELRKNGNLDRKVLLNDKARTPVRLISSPVDKETAALRRMKAKKDMHGHNPSAELLALLDWTIFITTIDKKEFNFASILHIYGLRWRIEVIFKTWKSHLNFDSIHRVSEVELKTLLTVRLLLVTEGTNVLYRHCYLVIRKLYDRDLSLQKLLKRLSRAPELFGQIYDALGKELDKESRIWEHLLRYCCYDKRTRKNFFDQCNDIP
jgi:hypothetical protein